MRSREQSAGGMVNRPMGKIARAERGAPSLLVLLVRHRLVTATALCIALGCTTARPILPGVDPGLRPGEGLLVLDLDSDVRISSLACSGVLAAHDLPPGEHLVLLAIDAGSYRWNRVAFGLDGMLLLDFRRTEPWSFRVEAGRISYPGQLVFRGAGRLWTERRLEARNINRSAMVFQRLRKLYPELLARYSIRYTGRHRDDFLERYTAALGAGKSATAQRPAP